jgi:hypothetical protein
MCVCVCVCIYIYTHKVVQIWPGLIVCKQVTVCPGHIWTTLYIHKCIHIERVSFSITLNFLITYSFLIIITWSYSPTQALASCAIRLHWSLSWAFLLHLITFYVQIFSWPLYIQAPCTMGAESLRRRQSGRGVALITQPHLALRLETIQLYLCSPLSLHDLFQGGIYLTLHLVLQ